MSRAALLVVDDDPGNRELLVRRLGRKGYAVTAVADGFEALEALSAGEFDLVLLDIMMPGMSGLDVLVALRLERAPGDLPVIMTTARADSEDVIGAMSLGATDYVTKPIDMPVLLARIEAQLSMRRQRPPAPRPAPASVASLGPGTVLDGRYEVVSELARGGFAVVYRARQVSTGQEVALKLIRPDLAGGPDAALEEEGFRHEMQVISGLRHPHIVRLIDSGALADGHRYTVLEYVEGTTLAEVLRQRGPLPPAEARRLLVQVLEALAAAHGRGVLHLDLKPQNIMVVTAGSRPSALVLDFGMSGLMTQGRYLPDELRGTPCYMSPEHLRKQPLTPAADIYAWGLIFIECLTGRVAVYRPSLSATLLCHLSSRPVPIPAEVACPELRRVIARAVAKPAEQRYPSAEALIADLEALSLGDAPLIVPGAPAARTGLVTESLESSELPDPG